jgi:hypothetical protein
MRIPISDGPQGRVGYLFFRELETGDWRLSMKEHGEHDSTTGKDHTEGVEALASALEGFGNSRVELYNKVMSALITAPIYRPGFRGNYRRKITAMENVRYHKSRNMLVTTCQQVGDKLREFNWPVPHARKLNDGTELNF